MTIYIVCLKERNHGKKAIEICKSCKDSVNCDSYKSHLLKTVGENSVQLDQEEKMFMNSG